MSFARFVPAKSTLCRTVHAPRYRPRLETLEDRLAPAVHTWDGSASASWNDAANWQENVVPVAGEANLQLVFPSGAANLGNTNSIVGLTVQAITISGTGYTIQGNDITLNGGITASEDATLQFDINLAATQTFTVAAARQLNLSGVISGAAGASLIKAGAGTLNLAGANDYAGATAVNVGILKILNASALGTSTSGTAVAEGASLQLQLANATVLAEALSLKGKGVGDLGALENVGGNNAWGGPITLTATAATPSPFIAVDPGLTLSLTGIVQGTGGFTKLGTGSLDLLGTAANSYAGVTRVNEGLLRLGKTAGITAIPAAVVVGDGVGAPSSEGVTLLQPNQIANNAAVSVTASGLLNLNGLAETIGALALTGGTVQTGAGTLTLTGNVVTNASAQQAVISGNLDLGGATRSFTVAEGSATTDLLISAAISNGALTKAGLGTLELSGVNTYAGLTRVNAGILKTSNPSSLGTTAAGTLVAEGATLQVFLSGITGETLTLSGKGVNNAGALQNPSSFVDVSWGGPVVLAATKANRNVVIGTAAAAVTLTGLISGSAGLTKVGDDDLILNGSVANTYAGVTIVNQGTLKLDNSAGNAVPHALVVGDGLGGEDADKVELLSDNQIADNAAVSVAASGRVDFSSAVLETIGALNLTNPADVSTSTGTLTINGNVTVIASASSDQANIFGNLNLGGTTRTFTVANAAAAVFDLIINAVISNGALTKAGPGTLLLNSNNSYGGLTRVQAGILEVFAPSALGTIAAGTIVAKGATLALDDTVVGETLTLSGRGVANLGALRGGLIASGTWNGPITLLATLANPSVFMGGTSDLTVNGIISGNAGLTKVGGSQLTLSGSSSNTYTGVTRLSSGALRLAKTGGATAIARNLIVGDGLGGSLADILEWSSSDQIANGATVTLKSSGLLQMNGFSETIHGLIVQGGAVQNVGSLTIV